MRFPDMIWLMLRGELPSRGQADLLEAAMVPGVDHGPHAPSIAIARMAVTCGLPVNGAMASAINVLDDIHGGAGQQCMELYREIDAEAGPAGDLVAAADRGHPSADGAAGEKIVPGFGHRFHPIDPRTAPLFALVAKAEAAGVVTGRFAAIGRAVEAALEGDQEAPHPDEHRRHHRRDLLRAGLRAGARPRAVRPVALGRHPRARVGAEAAAAAASWGRCRGKFRIATAARRAAPLPPDAADARRRLNDIAPRRPTACRKDRRSKR